MYVQMGEIVELLKKQGLFVISNLIPIYIYIGRKAPLKFSQTHRHIHGEYLKTCSIDFIKYTLNVRKRDNNQIQQSA